MYIYIYIYIYTHTHTRTRTTIHTIIIDILLFYNILIIRLMLLIIIIYVISTFTSSRSFKFLNWYKNLFQEWLLSSQSQPGLHSPLRMWQDRAQHHALSIALARNNFMNNATQGLPSSCAKAPKSGGLWLFSFPPGCTYSTYTHIYIQYLWDTAWLWSTLWSGSTPPPLHVVRSKSPQAHVLQLFHRQLWNHHEPLHPWRLLAEQLHEELLSLHLSN